MNPCRRCGHAAGAHAHYRKGTDCALCDCPRYKRPLPRWLRSLRPRGPMEWTALILLALLGVVIPACAYAVNQSFDHCLGASHSVTRAEVCAGILPALPVKGTP